MCYFSIIIDTSSISSFNSQYSFCFSDSKTCSYCLWWLQTLIYSCDFYSYYQAFRLLISYLKSSLFVHYSIRILEFILSPNHDLVIRHLWSNHGVWLFIFYSIILNLIYYSVPKMINHLKFSASWKVYNILM